MAKFQTSHRIELDETEIKLLTAISKSYTQGKNVTERARIVLAASNSHPTNTQIAQANGWEINRVSNWRGRWFGQHQQWKAASPEVRPPMSRQLCISWLQDKHRSGRKCRITPEQKALIQAIACESPQKYGYPQTHWTIRLLAAHIKSSGIVEDIGTTTVFDFLKCGWT